MLNLIFFLFLNEILKLIFLKSKILIEQFKITNFISLANLKSSEFSSSIFFFKFFKYRTRKSIICLICTVDLNPLLIGSKG